MKERQVFAINGFIGVALMLLLAIVGATTLINGQPVGVLFLILAVCSATGLLVVNPNQAYAVIFFGKYLGSVREPGFWWSVPFTVRRKVSLRVRNFNSKQLKVNDVDGNPIEIAAVIVFKVTDSA